MITPASTPVAPDTTVCECPEPSHQDAIFRMSVAQTALIGVSTVILITLGLHAFVRPAIPRKRTVFA